MSATTMLSQQQLIEAAKASLFAFNRKDWDAVRASVTPDVVYDEVGTGRLAQGIDQVLPLWQSWATAFPDAEAEFTSAFASDNNVVMEVTWRGTHLGPLQTPGEPIPPSGNRFEIRACFVVEMAGDKPKRERHYFDMITLLHQLGVK